MTTETLTQPQSAITRSALTQFPLPLKPSFIRGEILQAHYDDLLTAGLGREGLETLTAETLPRFASSPLATPEELRRNAILASHLGLIDRTRGAGYGTLYGPGVIDGKPIGDGRVPGEEYLAYAAEHDDPGAVVTMLVQVPDAFDLDHPCIVGAPSPGSSGQLCEPRIQTPIGRTEKMASAADSEHGKMPGSKLCLFRQWEIISSFEYAFLNNVSESCSFGDVSPKQSIGVASAS